MSAGMRLNDGTIIALSIVAIVAPRFRIIDFEVLRLKLFNLIDELLLILLFTLYALVHHIYEHFFVVGS